jgi:hypothetical protein
MTPLSCPFCDFIGGLPIIFFAILGGLTALCACLWVVLHDDHKFIGRGLLCIFVLLLGLSWFWDSCHYEHELKKAYAEFHVGEKPTDIRKHQKNQKDGIEP